MKNDLATAIIASVLGVLVAYFVSNIIIDKFAKSTYIVKNVDSSITSDLADPNPEVFNYKALNPTVEVYVGDCININKYGECADESAEQINQGVMDEEIEDSSNSDNSNSGSDSSSNSDDSSQNQGNKQDGTSN